MAKEFGRSRHPVKPDPGLLTLEIACCKGSTVLQASNRVDCRRVKSAEVRNDNRRFREFSIFARLASLDGLVSSPDTAADTIDKKREGKLITE